MNMYRWYYEEQYKTSISGVVIADSDEEAIEETKSYLVDQFGNINGEMKFISSIDEACTDEYNDGYTLFVWRYDFDADYHDNHPNCIAVSY